MIHGTGTTAGSAGGPRAGRGSNSALARQFVFAAAVIGMAAAARGA